MRFSRVQRIGLWALLVSILAGLSGCLLGSGPENPDDVIRTHYVLKRGETVRHPPPLPTMIPIWVEWHFSDGSRLRELGFRGWDFSDDGRIDLLEVLRRDGKVHAALYDLDLDGDLDFRKLHPYGAPEPQTTAAPPPTPLQPVETENGQ